MAFQNHIFHFYPPAFSNFNQKFSNIFPGNEITQIRFHKIFGPKIYPNSFRKKIPNPKLGSKLFGRGVADLKGVFFVRNHNYLYKAKLF